MSDPTEVDADATGATHREGVGARKSGGSRPTTEEKKQDLSRGTLIGRYVVIDVLGAGGMGVVYSAFDPELDRKVAIKLLQAQPGGSESGGQTWLVREAQAMARLAHPNVVAVYDVGAMAGDTVFVAMELVEGTTLRQWLKQKPRTWREVLPVMRAAGAGLAAAHAAGLVHRDFKPDNVLVGNDGRTRVMDFGLARLHGEEPASRRSDLSIERRSPLSERLTQTGAVLGTPAYMAPEIYGGHAADALADQFAFGVALYEALYRVRPFDRKALVEQRAEPPKPPANANVPAWIERIVLRAISLDPKQRFASMDQVLAALGKDPSATRKRIGLVAAVALVAGGAVATTMMLHGGGDARELPCTDAATKLAGAWDATTKTALERAFHAIGKPFAEDTLHGTEKTLDAYAARWVSMRTEACQATRVHGSQSEDVLTLRMACLDERLVEMQTLVGLFATADEKLVLGSVGAAQKLSSLADCANVPALLAPDPLPEGKRMVATALKAKLAEARAIYKTSRLDQTLALLARIAPDVERLGHKPTQAMLHLLRGQTLWVMKGAGEGEPELLQAAWTADAGKADVTKVEAWLQLTNLANESSHFDVAAERLHNASAGLTRLGTNWDLNVRVLAAQSLLDSRQNKYDDAIAIAKQMREMADQHTDAASISYSQLVEASILTSAGHAPEAIDDFRKVLAYQDSLGHHRIDVAVTLQTIAGAELAVGRLDDAIGHLQESLKISEAIYGVENQEIARILSAIGAAQAGKGDLPTGLATNQRALAIAERTSGKTSELYAFILGQVADTLVTMQRPNEAIAYLDQAIAIQTAKVGAGNVQTLTLMLTKCDAMHNVGPLGPAIEMCRKTLAAAEKALGKENSMLFLFYAHLGMAVSDAKQDREAVSLFDRALKVGSPDPANVYTVAMLDARALWATGSKKRAVELATRARAGFAQIPGKEDQVKDADDFLKKHR